VTAILSPRHLLLGLLIALLVLGRKKLLEAGQQLDRLQGEATQPMSFRTAVQVLAILLALALVSALLR